MATHIVAVISYQITSSQRDLKLILRACAEGNSSLLHVINDQVPTDVEVGTYTLKGKEISSLRKILRMFGNSGNELRHQHALELDLYFKARMDACRKNIIDQMGEQQ